MPTDVSIALPLMTWMLGTKTLGFLSLCLGFAWPASSQANDSTERSQQTVNTVLLMGDSLSAGYGLKTGEGWAWLLAEQLKPRGIKLINTAISGETTAGGAARLGKALSLHEPQLVIIQLGANDGLRGLPLEQAKTNLQKMIADSKNLGANVLLIGIKMPPNYGPDYALAFDQLYAELARVNQISLLPFLLEPIAKERAMFQADHLHPTAAAQPKLLAHVAGVLMPMLQR